MPFESIFWRVQAQGEKFIDENTLQEPIEDEDEHEYQQSALKLLSF